MNKDKVAIVILNWNGVGFLEKYIPVLLECSDIPGTVVYVADNGSTDKSVEMLKERFPAVRIVELEHNWGFAEGYNRALYHINAEYYVVLNSDVEVTRGWLSPIIEFMDNNESVAACQPKILAINERSSFEYAGACGGYIDRFGYPFCRGRIFDTVEKDNGQYDDIRSIMWASGACMVVRKEDFWRAGGFDSKFFAHNEEIDLCWRMLLSGRSIFCIPSSVVYHLGGGTLPQGNPRKTYLNFRNNLTMLYKNLRGVELWHVMFVRFFLDYIAAFHSLVFKSNLGDFLAIIRARVAFWRWRRSFDAERKKIDTIKSANLTSCRKSYSILWQYYIKRRKYFSDFKD